jgi:hypothetical protein
MATRYNYTGGIVTNGLVLNLDAAKVDSYPGTGTTWRDLSGNGNNGTLTNGPTFSGIGKQASIVFDGVDDYVGFTSQPLNSVTTAVTYASWYNITNLTTRRVLFSFKDSLVAATSTGFDYWWNVAATQGSLTANMSTGSWSHMVLTQNNTAVNLYMNGSPISSVVGGTITTQREAKAIGQYDTSPGAIGKFLGSISQAQIYNRALSASEVLQNYNATKGRFNL